MFRMCVYMHSRFVENHLIRILEDGPLIFEGVLSQGVPIVVLAGVAMCLTRSLVNGLVCSAWGM
jgi:hypothetical protein